MPKLKDITKSKEIKFDGDVIIYLSSVMTYGGVSELMDNKDIVDNIDEINDKNKLDSSVMCLMAYIIDWNIEDEKGKKLDINLNNIKKLPNSMIMKLIKEISIKEDIKKKKEQKA